VQSKLSIFCDYVLEAGWLLAAILAPLFFNVYSDRVFEPDKITLVRSIALVMVVAWLIRVVETSGRIPANGAEALRAGSLLDRLRSENPLLVPVAFFVVAYLAATITSIAPSVTIWGSYQRLQGTYSTFSYITIFALAAATIRSRVQVERVITTVILTSVPIGLYGMVEHLKLEFLPWGGDVTVRVTSTMGNAIFIAAYLIMVVPLSIGRMVERGQAYVDASCPLGDPWWRRLLYASMPVILGISFYLLTYTVFELYGSTLRPCSPQDPASICITAADQALLFVGLVGVVIPWFFARQRGILLARSGLYAYAAMVALGTIFYSQSRGPWIGLLGGVGIFVFIYAWTYRHRWLWALAVGVAAVGIAFLVLLNIPASPLEPVKSLPYIGRLGNLLETEGGSGKVRVLIWQGVLELIRPHQPIGIPERGLDGLNAIRPLVGYGPEAMYVAYNPFYPPDLAHVEARNASPDRSHNETFDALVQTGIIGFFAYWAVFMTLFWYALTLLHLVHPRDEKWLLSIMLGASLVVLIVLYGRLLPVALSPLPALALGLAPALLYLLIILPLRRRGASWSATPDEFTLLLMVLLAAVVAHFIEIQFGIAIASTKTHFWLYAAMIAAIGVLRRRVAEGAATRGQATAIGASASPPSTSPKMLGSAVVTAASAASAPQSASKRGRRSTGPDAFARSKGGGTPRPSGRREGSGAGSWWIHVLPLALVSGMIMTTLVFNFSIPDQTNVPPTAVMFFWLFFASLSYNGMAMALDLAPEEADGTANRLGAVIIFLVVSLALPSLYLFVRLLYRISRAASDPSGYIMMYYLVVLSIALLLAAALYAQQRTNLVGLRAGGLAAIYPIVALVGLYAILTTNTSNILADIAYKRGKAYDNAGRYDISVEAYQNALSLARTQDFYYLFLGRSFMELSRLTPPDRKSPQPFAYTVEDLLRLPRQQLATMSREDLVKASLAVLEEARALNPLNTDHYANLARLFRFWGETIDRSKFALSEDYFRQALILSPNSAALYNEWGEVLFLDGKLDEALEKFTKALDLDKEYAVTYFNLGEFYFRQGRYDQAEAYYREALKWQDWGVEPGATRRKIQAHSSLGYMYAQQGRRDDAIAENKEVLAIVPNDIPTLLNLGLLYREKGDLTTALSYAQQAQAQAQAAAQRGGSLDVRPQSFVQQLTLEIAARDHPTDASAHIRLAQLYQQRGQLDLAFAQVQYGLRQVPNDLGLLNLLNQLTQQTQGSANDKEFHRRLALAYRDKGLIDLALQEARRAAQLDPGDASLRDLVEALQSGLR